MCKNVKNFVSPFLTGIFQATNADELTMVEGEQLQMVGDGDESGWVKVSTLKGHRVKATNGIKKQLIIDFIDLYFVTLKYYATERAFEYNTILDFSHIHVNEISASC